MTTYKLIKGMQPADGSEAQIVAVVKDDTWSIPFDPANTDYQEYLKWVAEGNEPLPADA